MKSLGAKGMAEKTCRSSGRQFSASETAFYERFNEERSMKPSPRAPRRRFGSLPGAAFNARPRRGVPQPGRGFAR
jgi:hypothetical protein